MQSKSREALFFGHPVSDDLIKSVTGSASAELTGRVQPTVSKTLMFGYLASSANFRHSIRFPAVLNDLELVKFPFFKRPEIEIIIRC